MNRDVIVLILFAVAAVLNIASCCFLLKANRIRERLNCEQRAELSATFIEADK